MITIETEFYTKVIGLKEKFIAFLLVLFLLYSATLALYIYSMSTYAYVKVNERVLKQKEALSALDNRQLEVHNKIEEMLNEDMDH